MAKRQLVTPPYCTCQLPNETEIGWERAAYLALEAMQGRCVPRRPTSARGGRSAGSAGG